jgi:hypothetical protein
MVPVVWPSASAWWTYQWANEQPGHVRRREVGRSCLTVRGAQGAVRSSFGRATIRTLAGSERRRVASVEATRGARRGLRYAGLRRRCQSRFTRPTTGPVSGHPAKRLLDPRAAQGMILRQAPRSQQRLDYRVFLMTMLATISPRLRRLRAKRARWALCFLSRSFDGGVRLCIVSRVPLAAPCHASSRLVVAMGPLPTGVRAVLGVGSLRLIWLTALRAQAAPR